MSFNITNELGDPVKFIGLRYYQQILDFSDPQNGYVRSLLTSCTFALLVVTLQILCGLGMASLAMAKIRGIGIFRLIFITLTGMQAVPDELYESASLDGAGGWNKFRYITLPLITPILLFLLVVILCPSTLPLPSCF